MIAGGFSTRRSAPMDDNELIPFPQIHPEAMKRLLEVANLRYVFIIGGQRQSFTPREITVEMIESEAARLATIPNKNTRIKEIEKYLGHMLYGLRLAVRMASETAEMANVLEESRRELSRRGVPISIPPNAPKDLRW